MQAEAGAHALLPGALLALAFFDLRPDAGQRFASELAHLDVKQGRHNRDQWDYEDVCKLKNLLNNLRGRCVLIGGLRSSSHIADTGADYRRD